MPIDQFLRANFEPLQYAAFFGTLAVLAALEFVFPRRDIVGQRVARWPVNFGLTALNILVVSLVPVSGLFAADWAEAQGWGLLAWLGLPLAMAVAVGILLRSLVNYGVHLAMHKWPPLWRLHRVHHCDTHIDVSTAVRFHPVEFAVQVPVGLAAIVLLGIPPVAIILYELLDAAMAAFTHANIRLPRRLDRSLALILVTPAMHRIHHSARPSETDSNYGATFSIWDRLFGTFQNREEEELDAMTLGLREVQDQRNRSLTFLLRMPFLRRLARTGEGGPS